MKRCALVLAAALLSVTALAGCGSADDEAADDTDTTTSSSTEDETPDSDDTADADDDSGSDTSDKKDKPDKKDKSDKKDEKDDSDDADDGGDADDAKKKRNKPGKTEPAKADYCAMLKSLKTDFDPSNSASLAASRDFDAVVDRLEEVTDEAPARLRPAWQRLTDTFEGFGNAVDRYDIDLADPNALNKLKPKEKRALMKAVKKYQTPQVAKATSTIETDAKRRCNVTLG